MTTLKLNNIAYRKENKRQQAGLLPRENEINKFQPRCLMSTINSSLVKLTHIPCHGISLSLQTKTTHKVLFNSIYGPLTAQLNHRQFTIELKEFRALLLLSGAVTNYTSARA
jgi:hypothetical protein